MKIFFYTFVLLFAAVCCWAQNTVNYVSFFPPANIVHDKVQLTQNDDSFIYPSTSTTIVYTAQQGGLILGASNDSVTHISTITVNTNGNFAINNFNVDNIIKVTSTGTIDNIIIGDASVCDSTPNKCQTVFISANKIYFPIASAYPNGMNYKVYSNNETYFKAKLASGFPPSINNNEHLKWVNLRIDRTQECRRYLVKYTGTVPEDNCNYVSGS